MAGMKPDEIRNMIPKDVWLVFDGWQKAHSPNKAGKNAPSLEEAQELARKYG